MNTKATEINCNLPESAPLHGVAFPVSKFRQDMAESEQEFYRSKLAQSLLDKCGPNTDFRLAYKAQQRVLRDWVIAQPQFWRLVSKCTSHGISASTNAEGTKK